MSIITPRQWLACLLLGVFLALVYTAVEVTGRLLSFGKCARAVGDVLFMLLAAVCSFLLAFAMENGLLRLYQILGEAAGFFSVRYTVSRWILAAVLGLRRWICAGCGWASGKLRRMLPKKPAKSRKCLKKSRKIQKKA